MTLSEKKSSTSKDSKLTSILLLGLEKFARRVKSPLKYCGESKYTALRFALGMSNVGFLGLMARKMIKVASPKKISTRLNMRHNTAANHMIGLVL
ncbi:hypothetical protein SESBI_01331 [Sesbania bispinosa]|nr:hypothetical protein SESBI_01331 [Sesbania bispinosa]